MKTDKQEAMTKKEQIIEALYKRRDEFIAQRKKIKASETSEDIRSLDDAIQTILTYIPPEYFDILNVDPVNKWIRIESEEDLPKDDYGNYHVWAKEPIFSGCEHYGTDDFWTLDVNKRKDWLDNYSHYQPIQKPNPPIY